MGFTALALNPQIKSHKRAARNNGTFWFSVCLSLCYVCASLIGITVGFEQLPPELSALRFGGAIGSLVVLIPVYFKRREIQSLQLDRLLLALWLLFAGSCTISSIVNWDGLYATWVDVWLVVGVPIFFFLILPTTFGPDLSTIIRRAVFICCVGYLSISLIIAPNLRFYYKGILGHPNQVGILSGAACVCCITWFMQGSSQRKQSTAKRLCLLIVFFLLSMLLVLSASRTSVAATAFAWIALSFSRLNAKTVIRRTITMAILFGGTWFIDDAFNDPPLLTLLVGKHENAALGGAVLNGREVVWQTILGDSAVFGNGSSYLTNVVGISAHNAFLHILAQRGIISFVFFIVFYLLLVQRLIRRESRWKLRTHNPDFIIAFISFFGVISMAESTVSSLGTGITLAFYSCAGAVIASTSAATSFVFPRRSYMAYTPEMSFYRSK